MCIVSILRLRSLLVISTSTDPTFDNVDAALWSTVEVMVSIICACLPCLRPLISRYLPGVFPASLPISSPGTGSDTAGRGPGPTFRGSVTSDDINERTKNGINAKEIEASETGSGMPGSTSGSMNLSYKNTPMKPSWPLGSQKRSEALAEGVRITGIRPSGKHIPEDGGSITVTTDIKQTTRSHSSWLRSGTPT